MNQQLKYCSLFLILGAYSVQLAAQSDSGLSTSVEFGAGYNDIDSYKFGEFTGHEDRGSFAIGNISIKNLPAYDTENSTFWSFKAKNLGIESGSIEVKGGRQGSLTFSLAFDQIPHFRMNDAMSPFSGSGDAVQSLPLDWTGASSTSGFTTLSSSLKEVNIHTKRDRFTSSLNWQINQAWQLSGEYRHELKDGNETQGAIFGSNGGNPRGAILARPIDFQTDEVLLAVNHSGPRSQYSLSYNLIHFSNKDSVLLWDNPYNNGSWAAGANFSDGAVGQMALEPDNHSQQFTFSGGHSFDSGTRLSGTLSSTRLRQDDSFLPFSTIFPATTEVPRRNLGGKVDSLLANLNFSKRLSRRATLRLRYDYRDRDDKSPQALYLRIAGDSQNQGGLLSSSARLNRSYDLESSRFKVDFDYRFRSRTKLAAGYEYEEKDRSMVDVETTEENVGYLKLNFSSTIASGWLKLSRSWRDTSNYNTNQAFVSGHNPDYISTLVGNQLFENDPLLRRYHLADRDRDELSANLNIYPNSEVSLSLLAKIAHDDYPQTQIGLQESDKQHFAVDLSYSPTASWSASLYYNYENYANKQGGYAGRGAGSVRIPGNNWSMKSDDEVNTLGGSVDWVLIEDRLDLALDFSYTDAVTETSPSSAGQSFLPFPDVTTEVKSISLKASYKIRDDRVLRLRYFYERYKSDDFALDNVVLDTLSNVLLPGNQSPNYSGHMVELSVMFSFGGI